MKSTMLNICAFILMLFSLSSFAKITIKGNPVFLSEQGGIYYVPETYVTSTSNNYVTLDNTKKVCYLMPQPNLNSLNMKIIHVNIRGQQVQWRCYDYDETYFTASP
jgi:ABC-type microcin C transport system permease subunit YejE